MSVKDKAVTVTIPGSKNLQNAQAKAEQAVSTLVPRIQSVIITDAASYQVADTLLSRVTAARKDWQADVSTVLDPLNDARNALLEVRRKYDDPLKAGEEILRFAMKEYHVLELRRQQEEQNRKRLEEDLVRQEAERKRIAAEQAKTPQMRARLTNQAENLDEKADAVAATPISAPTQAAHSGQRVVKKCVVSDAVKLLTAVIKGDVPWDIVSIDDRVITAYYRTDPKRVATWPGVEVYDDVQIVRKR